MDNMIPFAVISGRQWYICRDCGNKELEQYNFCPVCKNTDRQSNEQRRQSIELMTSIGGKR